MPKNLKQYKTLLFDCDGVVLNSNEIKTSAFYEIGLTFGVDIASNFREYHVNNGGVSRFTKIEYLLQKVGRTGDKCLLNSLLANYEEIVRKKLLNCEIADKLESLRNLFSDKKWIMVSGAPEVEIREILKFRGISHFFDEGIYGSPRTKSQIFQRLFDWRSIELPAIYFGDSQLDFVAANEIGLDFIFISSWSEFQGWESFCYKNSIITFDSLGEVYEANKQTQICNSYDLDANRCNYRP